MDRPLLWFSALRWSLSIYLFKLAIRTMPDGDTKIRLVLGAQMGLGPVEE